MGGIFTAKNLTRPLAATKWGVLYVFTSLPCQPTRSLYANPAAERAAACRFWVRVYISENNESEAMKRSVYIETSVVSYLAAKPSRDVLVSARQLCSLNWWQRRRQHFSLFVSDVVLEEAGKGDAEAAKIRLALIADIPVAELNEPVRVLARRLLTDGALPPNASDDALHLAIAAVNSLDYLLTWNCRHIDNAEKKPLMRTVCMFAGFQCPEICTPDELMGD